jgi:4-amino-4-deoxy-L-arabinose transferase-like glycosyltransferase
VTDPATRASALRDRRVRLSAVRLALAALVALIALAPGIRAPFQKDAEPQSAEWIECVARGGHWIVQRDAYGFIGRKPPLFYWLSAAVANVSGGTVDEPRARAVSLAAGAALATIVLAWTAANVGAAEGWLAFVFLLGTYGFAARAIVALTDMLLTALVFAAWCLLYPQIEGRGSTRRAVAAGMLLGLAMLAKGPVALALTALAGVLYLLMTRGGALLAVLRQRWPWLAIAIAVAIAAVWYLPALIIGGREMREIFAQENLGHFAPRGLGGTGEASRPVYFIVERIAGGAFPLTLLLPAALAAFFTGEFSAGKRRPLLFQASLALAVVLLFSAASAKRDDYILPAMPGIAILCASLFALDEAARSRLARRLRDIAVGAGAALLGLGVPLAIVALRLGAQPESLPVRLQSSDALLVTELARGLAHFDAPYALFTIGVIAGATLAAIALVRGTPLLVGAAVAILALAGSHIATSTLMPDLAEQRSVRTFAGEIRDRIGNAPLCIVNGVNYELSFYYGARVPGLKSARCLEVAADGRPAYLFAYEGEYAQLSPAIRARLDRVMSAKLAGGPGPPSLYAIAPTSGLKPAAPADK